MKHLTLLYTILISLTVFAQSYEAKQIDYQNLDLHPPMKIDMILAGNFGEMRANHFHTGLDLKTEGVEGKNIYSIADGHVCRVRVSPWGYGLAVYVQHTNGLTSVYGHLSSFTPEIDSLVHACQVKNESYILDEDVLKDSMFVKKGQLIAYSGNSGSSSAPHLHFEIRETSTEHAINPLLFDCYRKKVKDTTKPQLKGIKLYAVTPKGYLVPGKSKYYTVTLSGNSWVVNYNKPIDISSLVTENSMLGIGLHVVDRLDAAGNVCGVYNTQILRGENLVHEQKMEYINFDHNRFMNSHQDYVEFDKNRRDIHKQFETVINPLPIYPIKGGLLDWDVSEEIHIKTFDVHGNQTFLNVKFTLGSNEVSKNPLDNSSKYYFPDSVNTMLREDFQVLMEKGTFYEPVQRMYRLDSNSTYLSPKYQFSEYAIPLQKNFDVRIKTPDLNEKIPVSKLGIGLLSDRNYLSFLGGDFIDGWVEAQSRSFGTFVLVVDTVAPLIKPLDFTENKVITKYKNIQLEIQDNLSGVYEYKAYLNGKWVVMEYNRRKGRYIVHFDKYTKPILRSGKNKLRIVAEDRKGNKSEAAYTLIY